MDNFICITCGTQYPSTQEPPHECHICNEERQYVHPNGQSWTTLEEMLQSSKYYNEILKEEENLVLPRNLHLLLGKLRML